MPTTSEYPGFDVHPISHEYVTEAMEISTRWIVTNSTLLFDSTAPLQIRSFTFLEVIGLMLMIVITLIALVGNMSILLVIVRSPQMRAQLAFLHLLNMCIIHILASVLVLPVSMGHFSRGHWPFSEAYCQAHQFFISFLSYSAILSMCVISIERYYSIRAPMHYAAHVTFSRTLWVIAGQHLYAALVSAIPFFIIEAPEPRDFTCGPRSEFLDGFYRAYIYILGLACFLIPAFVMLTMYSLVYKVAKHAARRVHPSGRGDNQEPPGVAVNATPFSNGIEGSIKGGQSADGDVTNTVGQPAPRCFIVPPPETASSSRPPEVNQMNETTSNIHWKAIKTLFLIITAFLVFWGPHFFFKLFVAVNGSSEKLLEVAISFQWLGWTSFAVNPFIYGGLNRNVREELLSQWGRLKSCFTEQENEEADDLGVPGENEDFFQFLERTTAGPLGPTSVHPMNGSLARELSSISQEQTGSNSDSKKY